MGENSTSDKKAGRVLLPNHVVPKRYDLHLKPNLQDFTFAGECDITLDVSNSINEAASKSITLHAKELCFATASFVEPGRGAVTADEIRVNLKQTTVEFIFPEPLTPGSTVELKIEYSGFLNNQMAGFYRSQYKDINGESKFMASTQFESLDARRCIPCVDEPAVKAVFGVTLTVESYLDVLSNMPVSHSERLSDKVKKISFQDTPIMSTYLLAICVGEFDCVQTLTKNGVSITVFTPPGKSESGRFALDAASFTLDTFDDFFQTKFPLPKLDMIAIPEFAMGAMENWGLVTYRETDLLIDPITASSSQKQRVATVVTHELSHQWFGNLVTMQWWDDLWLNEGFASWAENYAADKLFPEYSMWEQYTTGALATAMRLDALKSSHPIQVPIQHAEEVEQVFDAISYCKGGSVVRMIRAVVGAKHFQTALASYMKKHAYGNTETTDLWSALEDASGMPISQMMASWTEQLGFPILRIVGEDWQADKVSLELEQSWFLADGSALDEEGAAKKWTIPILTCTNAGPQSDMTLMREKTASVSIPLSGDQAWVKLNSGQEVPLRILITEDMLRRLAPAIQSKALSAIDRAALVNDGYALVKAGHQSPGSLIKLLGNYKDEDSYIVWEGLSSCILGLNAVLTDSDKISHLFKAFAKKISLQLMAKVGWESQASDGHLTTLLRGLMIALVSTFAHDDEIVKKEAASRFKAFQENPEDVQSLPGDMRVPVFKIVLKNGGASEYNDLKDFFFAAQSNADRAQVLRAIGHTQDSALKQATMEWATSGEVKLQDFFYAMGSVSGSGKIGADISWAYFQEHLEKIKSMIGNASSSLMDACIVMCASSFCSDAKANEIEAFFASHPLPSNTRKISQLLESMRSSAKFLKILEESGLSAESFWAEL